MNRRHVIYNTRTASTFHSQQPVLGSDDNNLILVLKFTSWTLL